MSLLASEIPIRKAQMRLEMKARRALLDESARARASWLASDTLGDWLQSRSETRIALYLARPFEVNLDALARELLREGRTLCAPRVDVAAGTMNFTRLLDLDAVTRGSWGVREPMTDETVQPEIVLAPGLGFDKNGRRLGTGGGWYDRVLADIPTKVGVIFRGQIAEEIPVEAHDISMDWVASDEALVRCGA